MSGDSASIAPIAVKQERPSRRILVVDDDPEALSAIAHILEHLGHVPVLCGSAEDAQRQLATGVFELLLIDYRMPEFTGIDLITLLHEEGCKIPMVMMTGYTSTDQRVSREELGITTILTKPIQSQQLSQAIEACVV